MVNLKLATQADIQTIYSLAKEIWYDHYPSIITMDQIDYMLANFYSQEALNKQMEEGQKFYLIFTESIEPMGYLAVTEKQPGHWFMNKFYIKTIHQSKGIGAEVLKIWEEMETPQETTLQVNRKNFKSINFYFKYGFRIKEVADFDIGNGYSMDDYIMAKSYN